MREMPKRKPNRLAGYDYSKNGAYFVTICTKCRIEFFGSVIVAQPPAGTVVNRPPAYVELSVIGKTVEKEIHTMQSIRKNITVDRYAVMPNHVHMIIVITDNGRLTTARTAGPTLSEIIRLWKRAISKEIGFSPWQKSYYDHIIRNEKEYNRIAEYIDHNPETWANDYFNPL